MRKVLLATGLLLSSVSASLALASMEDCIKAVSAQPDDMTVVLRAIHSGTPDDVPVVADVLLQAGDPHQYGEYLSAKAALVKEKDPARQAQLIKAISDLDKSSKRNKWLPGPLIDRHITPIEIVNSGVIAGIIFTTHGDLEFFFRAGGADAFDSARLPMFYLVDPILDDSELKEVFAKIAGREGLKEFEFSASLTDNDSTVVLSSVAEIRSLERIVLMNLSPGVSGVEPLRKIADMPNLKKFSLRELNLNNAQAMTLLKGFAEKSQLEFLDLRQCGLTDDCIPLISSISSLKDLALSGNSISNDSIKELKEHGIKVFYERY